METDNGFSVVNASTRSDLGSYHQGQIYVKLYIPMYFIDYVHNI